MEKMSSITALVIGDPHITQRHMRVVNQFLNQSVEICAKESPHFVVILGDVLHYFDQASSPVHAKAIKWFDALSKHTKKVFVLIGNHDRPNEEEYLSDRHFFNGINFHPKIQIVEGVVANKMYYNSKDKSNSLNCVFVPYVQKGRFRETIECVPDDFNTSIIFAHQEFRGSRMGTQISTKGDSWGLDEPYIVSGHMHECHQPQPNIFYTGTPYQTTYAESGEKKGIYIFTFKSDGTRSFKRYSMKIPIKVTVQKTPDEFETMIDPDDHMDTRIIINGKQEDIEALKKDKKYKRYKEMKNIKMVLRPIFEVEMLNPENMKSFKELLDQRIEEDDDSDFLKNIVSNLIKA